MSGHSKWANIKNRKGSQDKKRSATFTKVSKNLLTVLRTGGNLKSAIDKAREVNMPKENIDRLIERFEQRKAGLKGYMLEGFGPFGVPLMVEVETDNKNRILGEVRLIFKQFGGALGEEGGVGYLFDRVGEVELTNLDEELELTLIDHGATDFDELIVITEVANLKILADKIKEMGLEVVDSRIAMRIKNPILVESQENLDKLLELIEELEENDDVVNVFAGFDYHE